MARRTLFEVLSLQAEALAWMRVFKKSIQNKKQGASGSGMWT